MEERQCGDTVTSKFLLENKAFYGPDHKRALPRDSITF